MTILERPTSRRRQRKRRAFPRRLALALALIVVFVLGIAVGESFDDQPQKGIATYVRTLTPLSQQPPTKTVTVTVTQP